MHAAHGSIILANEPPLLRELLAYTFERFWGDGVALQMQTSSDLAETIDTYQPTWLILTLDSDKTDREKTASSLNVLELAPDGQMARVKRTTGIEEEQENLTLEELFQILESD
ncbi:MAG: hypothetical protein HZB51_21845 [Chloroflexi bacterium]|nr:hypothetical protein [Chloroflexota bacterium]